MLGCTPLGPHSLAREKIIYTDTIYLFIFVVLNVFYLTRTDIKKKSNAIILSGIPKLEIFLFSCATE